MLCIDFSISFIIEEVSPSEDFIFLSLLSPWHRYNDHAPCHRSITSLTSHWVAISFFVQKLENGSENITLDEKWIERIHNMTFNVDAFRRWHQENQAILFWSESTVDDRLLPFSLSWYEFLFHLARQVKPELKLNSLWRLIDY